MKEAIYYNIVNSMNKHDELDGAWQNIILTNSEKITERICIEERS